MFPFLSRSFINRAGILFRVLEAQRRQQEFAEGGFELFSLPIKKFKGYRSPRNLEELEYEVSHISAVKGGFGVSRKRVKFWHRQLVSPNFGEIPTHIITQLVGCGVFDIRKKTGYSEIDFSSITYAKIDELAQRLALWERYRAGVPYHQIGAANGDNLANRLLDDHTWHANLGNFGVGWALDVGAGEHLEDWHIETGRASLTTLTGRILEISTRARLRGVRIAPHRAFSPSRRGDTGANVHREIVIPTVEKCDALSIDYRMARGKGRPIGNDWDPNALYDAKGRPLS